jgi:hypothetical protein
MPHPPDHTMPTVAAARRRTGIRIGLYALAFRVCSALLAFFVNVVFPLHQPQPVTMFATASPFWDPFTRYDAGWYFDIARNGYRYVTGGRGNIAFFPVYPLLMRYVGRLFGPRPSDLYLGGILVSWVAFVLAMIALVELACLDVPRRRATRAALFAAVFPFAFFFGVVYTEAAFLLFTVVCFYGFRARWWVLGGVSGALATATRPTGIMMLPALAWIAWRSAEPNSRDRGRALVGLVLAASGFGAYCLYVYSLSGNPFQWAEVISRWGDTGYHPGGVPWMALVRLVQTLITHPYAYLAGARVAPYDTLNGVTALIFVAATPIVWWRLGAGYGLFMAANLWLPLSSGQYEGMGRYCSVMFPFFIWLAGVRSRAVFVGVIVASAVLYTVCLALFTGIYPLF